ncbi:hypothetical protein [Nonomuraea sp. LPB2021202275-12-8]|uniref:hypothetical protein n=1 Tax=Nonomuraea sp. LPB2021202275-12-8 TaxID=3120159 RepID=UPI00300D93E0
MAGTQLVPAQARRVPAARGPRTGRLLVGLGLPVLVAAGYEVYQVLVAVTHHH